MSKPTNKPSKFFQDPHLRSDFVGGGRLGELADVDWGNGVGRNPRWRIKFRKQSEKDSPLLWMEIYSGFTLNCLVRGQEILSYSWSWLKQFVLCREIGEFNVFSFLNPDLPITRPQGKGVTLVLKARASNFATFFLRNY